MKKLNIWTSGFCTGAALLAAVRGHPIDFFIAGGLAGLNLYWGIKDQ